MHEAKQIISHPQYYFHTEVDAKQTEELSGAPDYTKAEGPIEEVSELIFAKTKAAKSTEWTSD